MSVGDDTRNGAWATADEAFAEAHGELTALMDLLTLLEDAASQPRAGTLITMGNRGLACLERMDAVFEALRQAPPG